MKGGATVDRRESWRRLLVRRLYYGGLISIYLFVGITFVAPFGSGVKGTEPAWPDRSTWPVSFAVADSSRDDGPIILYTDDAEVLPPPSSVQGG